VLVITALVGSLELIYKNIDFRELSFALTIMQAVNMVFEAILYQIFGNMYFYFGTYSLYLVGSVFGIVSLILVFINKKRLI
ncbi:MAG: hypothetical protein WBO70_01065, partial [Erysipelotrichaceae bacterium]